MASTLAARLPAVITTPRGIPVLPEVYWMSAVSSPAAGWPAAGGSASSSVRGSITGNFGASSPDSRRCAAVRRSAKTAEGAASRTTLASRFTNAAGRANPSSEGRGTGTAPIDDAPRNPSRKARPVGTQSRTRSPCPRPFLARAAAQVPAPRAHSAKVTRSSLKLFRDALRRMWTATRSGSRSARSRSLFAIESGIRDQSFHQPVTQPAAKARGGKSAPLELVRHQRPVPVQHSLTLEAVQGVLAHLPHGQAELAPNRLREQRGDAGADTFEDQILHLPRHPAGELLAAALAGEEVGQVEAGLAKDEGAALGGVHGPERAQAGREEALFGEAGAFGVDLQVPGQLLEYPGVAERRIDQGRDAVHALTACSEMATVVPRPGSLSTRTVPRWAVTSSWTMERPRPVPEPGGLVVKNGSKMRERFSLVIPQPLSMTESSTRSPFRRAAIRTSPRCGSTACRALWTIFRMTWERSWGLARTTSPLISWTMRTPFG